MRDEAKSAMGGGFPHAPQMGRGAPMGKLYNAATKFVREEEGASLAEYGLLLALIAIVCMAGMTILGTNINGLFNNVSSTI
jgi:pilus assembly protein Flp/PilA